MEMTKERLEGYRSCREEIRELKYKLAHLGDGDSLIGNDVIMDYRTGYPRPQSIVGYDYSLEANRRERWEKLIGRLQEEVTEVEQWVEAIPDSITRRIFQMYFLEGRSQKKIGRTMHLDQSRISRKIDEYLKNA